MPLQDGNVLDDTRIQRTKETITLLQDAGAKIVLLSHLGRPQGAASPALSLRIILPTVARVLETPVSFCPDLTSAGLSAAVKKLEPGAILLLENLRFHPGEEDDDPAFAGVLASLGDLYVNEAFSLSHRAHCSVHKLAKQLPAFAGLGFVKEINALDKALAAPQRPIVGLVGGAKIASKINVIAALLTKVDRLIIGGNMAHFFLQAQGKLLCKNVTDQPASWVKMARDILDQDHENKIILPIDGVIDLPHALDESNASNDLHQSYNNSFSDSSWESSHDLIPDPSSDLGRPDNFGEAAIRKLDEIRASDMVYDIGPASIAFFTAHLAAAKTILWNGPFGKIESPPFDQGSMAIAREIGRLSCAEAFSIAGGGETLSVITAAGVTADFSYTSTAGGAFLEWIEGKTLPGVEALER